MMPPGAQAKAMEALKDPSKLKDMLHPDKMEEMKKALGAMGGGMKQKAPKIPANTAKDPMNGLAAMLQAHTPGLKQQEAAAPDPMAELLKNADLSKLGEQMQEMMKGVDQEQLMGAMKNFDPAQMQNMMKSMMG